MTSPQTSRLRSKTAMGQGFAVSPSSRSTGESGLRKRRNHAAIQTTPIRPVIANAPRQPVQRAAATISGGASTAPNADPPVVAMPIASARSLFGNHSRIPFAAPGKQPPSPAPSMNRNAVSCDALWGAARATAEVLKTARDADRGKLATEQAAFATNYVRNCPAGAHVAEAEKLTK